MPPSNIDLVPPFDATGYDTLTAAQLQQLVSGLVPMSDKGLIIKTVDVNDVAVVPDANTTVKWQNYLWLRVSATMSTVYAWNVNAINPDNDFLHWIPVTISGIGPGDITTDMLADGAVTDLKITSVDYSKLTGIPPALADGAVTYAKLATNAVSGIKVADDGIWPAKLKSGGTVGQIPAIDASGILFEWVDPSTVTAPTPSDYNKLLAADGSGGFEYVAKTDVGNILQDVYVEDTATDNNSSGDGGLLTDSNTHPTITMGKDIPGLTISGFTPKRIGSSLIVDVLVNLRAIDDGAGYSALALFKDGATNAVAGTIQTTQAEIVQYKIRYKYVTVSLAAIDFTVRYMATNHTVPNYTYYNSEPAGGLLNGLVSSSIRITEVA